MHSHTLARDAFQCVRTVFSDPGREKVKYHDQKRTLFEQLKNGVKKSKTPGEKKHLGNLSKTSCFVHFLANRRVGYFLALIFLKKSYANRLIYMTFERVCEKFPLPGRKNELSHTRSKMLRNSTRELVCEKKPSVLSRKTHSTLAFSHTRSERLSLFEDRF